MTEKEAIKALKIEGGLEVSGKSVRVIEFFKGLIEAEKALKEIQQYRAIGTVEECKAAVERMERSTAHYNGGWIPVEERLPSKPEENPEFDNKPLELYLASVRGTKYPLRVFWNGKIFTDGWGKLDVTAWMPLPEPYQSKGE